METCLKKKTLICVLFIFAYLFVVLYISTIQDNCPAPVSYSQPVDEKTHRSRQHPLTHEDFHEMHQKLVNLKPAKPAAAPRVELQKREKRVFDARDRPHDRLLHSDFTPNTVHFVWCGRKWFEFHHYLSVMSVIRELAPDIILFHYQDYPFTDRLFYNTWLADVIREFPFLIMKEIPKGEKACEDDYTTPNLNFILKKLRETGGLYISETTLLADFPLYLRNLTFVNALDQKSMQGFLMSKPGVDVRKISDVMNNRRYQTTTLTCGTAESYVLLSKKHVCVNIPQVIYPKDIWELDDPFGRVVRKIFYGDPEIPKPKKSYDELIPNIAHICWIGGGDMDFLFYLGVLSLLYVAKVDVVYIHGSAPTGVYWNSLKGHSRIKVILRETPKTVYGNRVHVLSHVTDVWRVDFMIKYGGIYVDTDTVFVRPLDREIRSYDAVGSYDWTDWHRPFPDIMNFGVAIGKRNATFWRKFQESMRHFVDRDWALNGLRKPYKIKERHPELLSVNPRLQIICFELKCHPTWHPGYHNESIHHENTKSIPNWRKDVYAFHWTLPTPPELKSEDILMNSSGMFAEIGKYILRSAGKIL